MKLFQNFRNYQKNIALTNRSNKKITYQDLNSICEKIKKNLKKKSLVLIFAGNNLGSIISYIFSQKFSFPAILINDDLEKKEVLKIVDLYQPKFIFCEKKIFSKFKEKKFKKNFNFLNIVIYENTNTVEYKIHQKLALLLTTSGTMGTA